MFPILYNILLILLLFAFMPKILIGYLKFGKYKDSFKKRLGFDFPQVSKGNNPLIWIHAVSMGETKAIAPLAKTLKETHPRSIIIVSSITETGHAEAKKSLPFADLHVYMPYDFSWIIRPIVKRVKPDLVILCETDLWYNFLFASKKEGARIVIVNGKLSERSLSRFARFPFFSKRLFALVDQFCLQSERYKKRFLQLGIPEDKIFVTGNIKLDGNCPHLPQNELKQWQDKLKISKEGQVVVAGSTHNPEEKILLDTFQKIWEEFPDLKLLLVPRHPERFNEVDALLKDKRIPFARFSELDKADGKEKVVLIDAMGQLRTCYQIADVAFVGGSYTAKVGGHNILEPSWYGKPVIFGPHMHTQLDLVDFMNEFQAGLQVPSEKLEETFLLYLRSKEISQSTGEKGLKLVKAMQGATDRTYKELESFLQHFSS